MFSITMKVVFWVLLVNAQHLLEKYTYLELIISKIIIYLRKLGLTPSRFVSTVLLITGKA
ncbi:Uncharacterised protein [Escherichia coli]|uniref:Uncharacterized protein n=3 Tax=Escherichia coli TaxID=562 RepID=A0A376ZTU8_ECOLX|nr:Uncharacterised protein [Escherichia coli]